MQCVVDASVAAKWFLPEPYKDEAEELLRDFLDEKVELIAPDLIVSEVGNILWKRSTLRGEISATQASRSYANFLALGLILRPSSTIAAAALKLATERSHPVYDMLYVALAEQNGCDFVTADEKLVKKLGAKFPLLRWLGDFTTR
jgi:predicted nucleic acid-binding protein